MELQLQTALIAAVVALITASLGSYITWRLERRKWLTGLKASLQVELLKARIQAYPPIFKAFERLSSPSPALSPAEAEVLAHEFNAWVYSAGGMTAEPSTRSAVIVVRRLLFRWARDGRRPDDFDTWRLRAILLLRRDVDVPDTTTYGPDASSLFDDVRVEAERVLKRNRRRQRVRT